MSLASERAAHPNIGAHDDDGETWVKDYVASGDLAEKVAKLKAREGKPIVVGGGAAFARSLIASDLVVQYRRPVHPCLGQGSAILSKIIPPMRLNLFSAKAFPRESVAQIYRPA